MLPSLSPFVRQLRQLDYLIIFQRQPCILGEQRVGAIHWTWPLLIASRMQLTTPQASNLAAATPLPTRCDRPTGTEQKKCQKPTAHRFRPIPISFTITTADPATGHSHCADMYASAKDHPHRHAEQFPHREKRAAQRNCKRGTII